MSCKNCTENSSAGFYRWKDANIVIEACDVHGPEIMDALNKAQRTEKRLTTDEIARKLIEKQRGMIFTDIIVLKRNTTSPDDIRHFSAGYLEGFSEFGYTVAECNAAWTKCIEIVKSEIKKNESK